MPTKRDLVIELAVMVAVGMALAALGPFGTYQMGPFAERLAYWLPVSLFGYAVFRPVTELARRQAQRLDLPGIAGLLAGVAVAAAPVTLVLLWWNGQAFAARPHGDWVQSYLQVALSGALVTLIFMAIERRRHPLERAAVAQPVAAQAKPSRPPFFARLPASWDRELIALEMEDHYVRAHRPGASILILMRLRDAEGELDQADGLRVHRSWWVARAAVEQVVRDGRCVRLKLKGGLEAPVARNRLATLRTAGWLD